jgi:hypothetical protein
VSRISWRGGFRRGGTWRIGPAGLAASGLSAALTFTVAVLGPSLMEPSLPGRPGQPPWSAAAHPSPYLVVALTGAAIVSGTAGLWLTIGAVRRGWRIPPGVLLGAGILVAMALALVPPFGSSDHLSYAAYGRMAVTGHNPYATTPAALARLGDPVARAVQDWRNSPSVYGALATGGQVLASLIGGTSVRLTVFVLSLLNAVSFAITGLILHGLGRGDQRRQLRAAVLWTANPLLLQVLVAGAHVDSQAVMFGVAGLAVFGRAVQQVSTARRAVLAAVAGVLTGLGFAVKATMVLVGAGLAIGCLLGGWGDAAGQDPAARGELGGRPGTGWRDRVIALAGLAAGFAVLAGASLAVWGVSSLRPALSAGSYVSIGSPWRAVRSALHLGAGLSEAAAEDVVKVGAVVLAVILLALLLAAIARRARRAAVEPGGPVRRAGQVDGWLAASAVAAVALAWLFAWPYVLPWYDALGWAVLAVLPWSRLDWLLLARTAALAVGYLPARGTVTLPSGLGWLETVVRTGVTPPILLACLVALIVTLRPGRGFDWPGPW